jgi:hypothetical protein
MSDAFALLWTLVAFAICCNLITAGTFIRVLSGA